MHVGSHGPELLHNKARFSLSKFILLDFRNRSPGFKAFTLTITFEPENLGHVWLLLLCIPVTMETESDYTKAKFSFSNFILFAFRNQSTGKKAFTLKITFEQQKMETSYFEWVHYK